MPPHLLTPPLLPQRRRAGASTAVPGPLPPRASDQWAGQEARADGAGQGAALDPERWTPVACPTH